MYNDDADGKLMMMMLMLTVERLGSCYIKVDDVKQHHCPLYKSFSIPPAIHISQPFGVSIFTPSAPRNDEQHQLLHTRELLQPKTKEPDCWYC